MSGLPVCLDLPSLRALYASGELTPSQMVDMVLERIGDDRQHAWISVLPRERLLAYAERLQALDPASLPLYGVPFAIKDNIDLADWPTTAACPAYAYTPAQSATVVQLLIDAGAIPIGKTNLDQFATGLNGTRSPFGICHNAFNPDYIAGGSSSGSAVAVALGQVSFSLGTDTAGSGRVPAAFNNLIGWKSTRGVLSTSGVVPACRSLDCVTVFALTAHDAAVIAEIVAAPDETDAYSRAEPAHDYFPLPGSFRFGVPRVGQRSFFGNGEYAGLFDAAIAQAEALGGIKVEIDFLPLLEAARLLYDGPWLAERRAAVGSFVRRQPEDIHPVIRDIIDGSPNRSAVETFRAMYRLQALKAYAERLWCDIDVLLTPTTGCIFRIDDMLAEPILHNNQLGHYTNFMNLLDLSAVAVPSGFDGNGLPFGVTLAGPAFADRRLLALAARWQQASGLPLGTGAQLAPSTALNLLPADSLPIVVCGAHLSGLPLNPQLLQRGAVLLRATRTAPKYRFYALAGGPPFRPGLIRVDDDGAAIEVEVWAMPTRHWGSFVAGIPAPLAIGSVELEDGTWAKGFVCEAIGVSGARDITQFGSWRSFLQAQNQATLLPA